MNGDALSKNNNWIFLKIIFASSLSKIKVIANWDPLFMQIYAILLLMTSFPLPNKWLQANERIIRSLLLNRKSQQQLTDPNFFQRMRNIFFKKCKKRKKREWKWTEKLRAKRFTFLLSCISKNFLKTFSFQLKISEFLNYFFFLKFFQ